MHGQGLRDALSRLVDPQADMNIVEPGPAYGIDLSPQGLQMRMTVANAVSNRWSTEIIDFDAGLQAPRSHAWPAKRDPFMPVKSQTLARTPCPRWKEP
ncbi:MAG: hypothetical protein H6R06_133 [Proteobacteria bacterium]|jgi:hypothetical protein|nr:hypothetical protein [Pseudomonadota bacterium]